MDENSVKIVGRLKAADMKFIRDNVDKLPPDKIAEALNRKTSAILNYIQQERLGKAFKEVKDAGDVPDSEILRDLRKKTFHKDLKNQLMPSEIVYFEDHWISMVSQFGGDIMASEEMELKELIILEILKNRESAAEKSRIEMKLDLERQIKEERALGKLADRDTIRDLNQQILNCSAASSNYVRNFKELCDRADKMRKALHASRQDRVKSYENSKIDFAAWLKSLEDHSQKLKVAREMEVLRQAQIKERRRLYDNHKYANNEVAVPILNEDSVGTNNIQ